MRGKEGKGVIPTPPNPPVGDSAETSSAGAKRRGGTDATRIWDELYEPAHGVAYVWQKKDAVLAAGLFNKLGESEYRRVVANYFANSEPFVAGHPVGKLQADVNRYRIASVQRNGSGPTRPTAGATSSLLSGLTEDFDDPPF